MKAIVCKSYGGPEVLQLAEVAKPVPKTGELLVKVMSTTVNSGDARVRGNVSGLFKIIMRLMLGWRKPRQPVLGTVFSGIVEQTGAEVTGFQPGDAVFGTTGFRFGTYAEYLTVSANGTVTLQPANASFDEAAALPFGGMTAYYFLEKAGIRNLRQPQVLIIGSSGSVGTAAVQIARHFGAVVTAVCSSAGIPLMHRLDVPVTIAYDREDFTQLRQRFDLIFDAGGHTTRKQCKHLLKPGARYSNVGGWQVMKERREQLELLRAWFESGAYQAVIDCVFPMESVAAAHRHIDSGRKKGNVVLQIGSMHT